MARHSFVFQEQPRGKTFNRSRIIGRVACLLWITLGLAVSVPAKALALDWVPTDQEIQKYRQSWNPLSNGPIFISGVDVFSGFVCLLPSAFTCALPLAFAGV